jgi:hypothetical protein
MYSKLLKLLLPVVVLAIIAAVTIGAEGQCCLPRISAGLLPLPEICIDISPLL